MHSRNLVLGLLAAALVLTTAPPALAGTWSAPDPAGNAEGWHFDPEPAPCGTVTELDGTLAAQADLTRLSVQHQAKIVRVKVAYADVKAAGELQTSVQLRAPGQDWEVHIMRMSDGQLLTYLSEAPDLSELEEPTDECGAFIIGSVVQPCRGLAVRVRPAADRIDVRVPRKCIGDPRWVRASVYSGAEVDGEWYADAWGPGGTQADYFHRTFGPRVRASR